MFMSEDIGRQAEVRVLLGASRPWWGLGLVHRKQWRVAFSGHLSSMRWDSLHGMSAEVVKLPGTIYDELRGHPHATLVYRPDGARSTVHPVDVTDEMVREGWRIVLPGDPALPPDPHPFKRYTSP